jgi:hypothetical protein
MKWINLSELNQYFVKKICQEFLSVETQFMDSRELEAQGSRQDRLINLLCKVNADYYLSGPAAKEYIDEKGFKGAGIELQYKDYSGYPEYQQLFPPFEHHVSILDLLFSCGPCTPDYIWGWRQNQSSKD